MKNDNEQSVKEKWGATHTIEKRMGTDVDLRHLNKNQGVCFGDGETFHWLLTEKDVAKSNLVQADVIKSVCENCDGDTEGGMKLCEQCSDKVN